MEELELRPEEKVYWLDGFEGQAQGGAYYRSGIAIDIDDFETKFNKKVVAIGLTKKYNSDKPSWNVNMITEVTEEDKINDIAKAGHSNTLKDLATGTDEIHEAEEQDITLEELEDRCNEALNDLAAKDEEEMK